MEVEKWAAVGRACRLGGARRGHRRRHLCRAPSAAALTRGAVQHRPVAIDNWPERTFFLLDALSGLRARPCLPPPGALLAARWMEVPIPLLTPPPTHSQSSVQEPLLDHTESRSSLWRLCRCGPTASILHQPFTAQRLCRRYNYLRASSSFPDGRAAKTPLQRGAPSLPRSDWLPLEPGFGVGITVRPTLTAES